jgi:maltooligosyltrehalose trehalohydrolase
VQEGRKKEFAEFNFGDDVPDPQDENTFSESKLRWDRRNEKYHKTMLDWYKELIRLRRSLPSLKEFDKKYIHAEVMNDNALAVFRQTADNDNSLVCLFNFSEEVAEYTVAGKELGEKILDSKEEPWLYNPGAAKSSSQVRNGTTVTMEPLSVVIYTLKITPTI